MSDRKSTTMSTGKAFSNPSAAKVEQQRKILEALERQKKLIKTSTTGSTAYDQSSLSNTVPVAASEATNSISNISSTFELTWCVYSNFCFCQRGCAQLSNPNLLPINHTNM